MANITLSPKHGLNPTMGQCYLCGEASGEIAMLGRYKERNAKGEVINYDAEAPRRMVLNKQPCPKCKEYMQQGIILIGCTSEPKPNEEPNRSGHFLVVKEDWVKRSVQPQSLQDSILQARVAFIPKELVESLLESTKQNT